MSEALSKLIKWLTCGHVYFNADHGTPKFIMAWEWCHHKGVCPHSGTVTSPYTITHGYYN